jgi:hypothetical protein
MVKNDQWKGILKEVVVAYCDGETKERYENRIAHKLSKIPSKLVQTVVFYEWYLEGAWFESQLGHRVY